MTNDRQRETFDQVPEGYDSVRPATPAPAVSALWSSVGLAAGDRVLEIGCGTGQLTAALLSRGARILALEPGAALAERCFAKHACPELEIATTTFEAWTPGELRFACVVAAQAAHWIEPRVFLERSLTVLESRGSIGLIWHVDVSQDTPFWRASQPLYDRFLPESDQVPPRTIPRHVAAYEAALAAHAGFQLRPTSSWPWTRHFDTSSYLELLKTHSPVRMLDEAARRAFLEGHAELIDRTGGTVERHYETVLVVAVRSD